MFEADFDGGPIRAEREMLGPLDDYDGFFGEGVLQAEGFEVVKVFDSVEIDVVYLERMRTALGACRIVIAKLVDEIEGWMVFG